MVYQWYETINFKGHKLMFKMSRKFDFVTGGIFIDQ
jgi:hypothetical protein